MASFQACFELSHEKRLMVKFLSWLHFNKDLKFIYLEVFLLKLLSGLLLLKLLQSQIISFHTVLSPLFLPHRAKVNKTHLFDQNYKNLRKVKMDPNCIYGQWIFYNPSISLPFAWTYKLHLFLILQQIYLLIFSLKVSSFCEFLQWIYPKAIYLLIFVLFFTWFKAKHTLLLCTLLLLFQ